jgi:drug/metabolite transporter (DMT)-like permease
MFFGMCAVSIYLIFTGRMSAEMFALDSKDVVLILILGILATAFAYIVSIDVMKVLSPFTCALTINLEPLYTIVFALWMYGEREHMSPQFYLGSVLILSTLFIEAFYRKKKAAQLVS